ncbi:DoxX family membrane protein [Microbispora cellulosiformans]|uniref:DoxX family membrane protein n=1 Tax=Microbispora cellulosiformans TaxID=2614688 RepID=A0A5J5JX06_9ACTN|nr:DoxX family membrane protein [Microbispora cellulosiformans]KAA9375483.1 DoxX family membrane protein [Microbispora cellulosiformans]
MAITEGRNRRNHNLHPAAPTVPVTVPAPRTNDETIPATTGAGPVRYVWAAARIAIGWVFLWAFLDKLFGWGFATPAAKAWINGGSPTTGFLKGTADRTFGDLFGALAGQAWVDWLFMTGLLGIGAALILGVGMRIAAAAGGLLLLMMWAAELPLTTNPFMDEHIVYAIVLAGLALGGAGATFGLGRIWAATPLVRRFPILK